MKSGTYLPLILAWSLSTPLSAAEALDLDNETTRINYSLGFQIGGDFKRQKVEMDAEAVVQGIRDALSDAEPQMPAAEMRATLMELKRKVVSEQQERKARNEAVYLAEGKAFMEENTKKEGVVTTDTGLQYQVIEAGTGKQPGPEDEVTVHYRGAFTDGTTFKDTYRKNEPATFKVNSTIKGLTEGLQLMKEGGKTRLFVPQNLAYGHRGPLAHRTVIFDIELVSVGEAEQGAAQDEAASE